MMWFDSKQGLSQSWRDRQSAVRSHIIALRSIQEALALAREPLQDKEDVPLPCQWEVAHG
jgi:hypothetical protein